MQSGDIGNPTKHDPIKLHCILCAQQKEVPPGTIEYERAHRGEHVPFTCSECDGVVQKQSIASNGDDPLNTP